MQARRARSLVAQWRGRIGFTVPHGRALLEVTGDGVGVVDEGAGDIELEMTQAEFVQALLGITGLLELPCAGSAVQGDPRAQAVLGALFPRCAAGSGPWG